MAGGYKRTQNYSYIETTHNSPHTLNPLSDVGQDSNPSPATDYQVRKALIILLPSRIQVVQGKDEEGKGKNYCLIHYLENDDFIFK